MCGPIALAIPVNSTNALTRFTSIMLYNGGRVFTYTLLGLLLGSLGKGASLLGYQQQLSVLIGIGMIVYALLAIYKKSIHLPGAMFNRSFGRLKSKMGTFLKQNSYDANLLLGLLNGLLPCGMVYFALAGAAAWGGMWSGGVFMFFFGLGTLPVMLLMPYLKSKMTTQFRLKLQTYIPVFLLVFGVLLLVRGANLGIPYLSPKMDQPTQHNAELFCH
jgi:sulfite exporter TauE/SafE